MKDDNILSENVGLNNNEQNKIKIVNCPHDCINCKIVLSDINRFYHESEHHQNDKEYQFSILSLKKAFEKTYELSEPVAQECVGLFRFTIMESLENISKELKRTTKGLFRNERYKKCCKMAEETLKEFKKVAPAGKQREMQNSSALHVEKKINLPAV